MSHLNNSFSVPPSHLKKWYYNPPLFPGRLTHLVYPRAITAGGWDGYHEDRMSNFGGGLKAIDSGTQKIERFEKNCYVRTNVHVASRTDKETEEFRRAQQIKVRLDIRLLDRLLARNEQF